MTSDEKNEAVQKFADYLQANGLRDVHVMVGCSLPDGAVEMFGRISEEMAHRMLLIFMADIKGLKVVEK
jgi:hypothetical protein